MPRSQQDRRPPWQLHRLKYQFVNRSDAVGRVDSPAACGRSAPTAIFQGTSTLRATAAWTVAARPGRILPLATRSPIALAPIAASAIP
ncbi:hypothetical protein [Kibdelosporangium philippinense]|uniref:hypothetical protein n=1 Tax=Kibdelosporangium philippinense TaxID=211113 RepID=UPI0036231496